MKKKLLAAGLTVAAILTITACGDKTANEPTTEATTAVETTAETTLSESESAKDTVDSETTERGEAESLLEEAEEASEEAEPTAEEIALFAKKVQDVVSVSDIEALADLCAYPVFVSLKEGEGKEIETKEDLIALGADKIFTDALMAEMAEVKPEKLQKVGAGVIMGEEPTIIFNKLKGQMVVTAIMID